MYQGRRKAALVFSCTFNAMYMLALLSIAGFAAYMAFYFKGGLFGLAMATVTGNRAEAYSYDANPEILHEAIIMPSIPDAPRAPVVASAPELLDHFAHIPAIAPIAASTVEAPKTSDWMKMVIPTDGSIPHLHIQRG